MACQQYPKVSWACGVKLLHGSHMRHEHRRDEFTGMARIEELPEDKKVAALFNGAEGVGGLVTMLMVRPLHM
jgi:hypothetical protein